MLATRLCVESKPLSHCGNRSFAERKKAWTRSGTKTYPFLTVEAIQAVATISCSCPRQNGFECLSGGSPLISIFSLSFVPCGVIRWPFGLFAPSAEGLFMLFWIWTHPECSSTACCQTLLLSVTNVTRQQTYKQTGRERIKSTSQ